MSIIDPNNVKKINDLQLALPIGSMQLETDRDGKIARKITVAGLLDYVKNKTTLLELKNINADNISNNQYLVYDGLNSEFIAKDIPPTINNLRDISNVMISSIANGEYLVYNTALGAWRNQALPFIPTKLTELTDVVVSLPTNSQILIYDGGSGNFINMDFPINVIDDLNNVVVTNLQPQQVLTWNGSQWVNTDQLTIQVLNNLTDVDINSPFDGQILRFDDTTSTWQNKNMPAFSGDLNDLGDVDAGTPNDGDIIIYDAISETWNSAPVPPTVEVLNDLDDVNTTPSTGDVLLNDGNEWVNSNRLVTAENNISTNTSDISTNTSNISTNTSDISTNTSNISTNTSNISTNTSNISTNTSDISTNAGNISTNTSDISSLETQVNNLDLDALTDVAITSVADNNILRYDANSSTWNNEVLPVGVKALDDLNDVTITGIQNDNILKYDGSNFVNTTLALPNLSDVTLTSINADDILRYDNVNNDWRNQALPFIPTNINDLGDVTITGASDDEVLTQEAGQWVNKALPSISFNLGGLDDVTLTGIQDAQLIAYDSGTSEWVNVTPTFIPESLNDLTDVTVSGVQTDEILRYNGTNFVNTLLNLNDLNDVNISTPDIGYFLFYTTAGGGQWVGTPVGLPQLNDIDITSPVIGQVLKITGLNPRLLTNEYVNLPELGDVNITSVADNQIIRYDNANSEWVNSNLADIPFTLDDLDDVSVSNEVFGHILFCVGSGSWLNTILDLDRLSDASVLGASVGDFLQYDGANFGNTPLTLDKNNDVSVSNEVFGHILFCVGAGSWLNTILDLDRLSDASVLGPSIGDFLQYDGANFGNTPLTLNKINDVDESTPADKDMLVYDGANSVYENRQIDLNDLASVNVDTDPNNLSNIDFLRWDFANKEWTNQATHIPVFLADLSDVDAEPFNAVDKQILQYDASQSVYVAEIPTLNTLTDVDTSYNTSEIITNSTRVQDGSTLVYNQANDSYTTRPIEYEMWAMEIDRRMGSNIILDYLYPDLVRIVSASVLDKDTFPEFFNLQTDLNDGSNIGDAESKKYFVIKEPGWYEIEYAMSYFQGSANYRWGIQVRTGEDDVLYEMVSTDTDWGNANIHRETLFLNPGMEVNFPVRVSSTANYLAGNVREDAGGINSIWQGRAQPHNDLTITTYVKITKLNRGQVGGGLPLTNEQIFHLGINRDNIMANGLSVNNSAGISTRQRNAAQHVVKSGVRGNELGIGARATVYGRHLTFQEGIATVNNSINTIGFIDAEGKVYTMGNNADGQCGVASADNFVSEFTHASNINAPIRKLVISQRHAVAIPDNKNTNSYQSPWWCGSNSLSRIPGGSTNEFKNSSGQQFSFNCYDAACTNDGTLIAAYFGGTYNSGTGDIIVWGNNINGQLGAGFISEPDGVQVGFAGGTVRMLASGPNFSIGLGQDTPKSTGVNQYGQLGRGNTTSQNTFQNTTSSNQDYVDIACGFYHSVWLNMANATVVGAGRNEFGATGQGTFTGNQVSLKNMNTPEDMIKIDAAGHLTLALGQSQTLYYTGTPENNILGDDITTAVNVLTALPHLGKVRDFKLMFNNIGSTNRLLIFTADGQKVV